MADAELQTDALTPLTDEDAQILALEAGPIRGHTLKVLVVDDAPADSPLPALRAQVDARLPALPRWRQRLVAAPGSPTGLAWRDDADFRVERHVRGVRTDGPVDTQRFREIVASTMATALDRDRPLWTIDVVPRLADGRWALLWKVHHALADGVTVVHVGPRLLWDQDAAAPARVPGQRSRPGSGAARSTVGAQAVTFARYLAVVRREFGRIGHLSPLAGDVGADRTVAFARCAVDELRSVGKRVAPEVTVNDVLLALVAGALRGWLRARGRTGAAMKVQVPVSMHPSPAADEPSGNRDSFLFVALPVTEADPVARVRAINDETRMRKHRHDAATIDSLRSSLTHAPRGLRRRLQQVVQGPHEYSLNVSNVPGPPGQISVLGRAVDGFYSIAEIAPRHALRIAAVSMGGTLFIGLLADRGAVPDLQTIADGIGRSLNELRQAAGSLTA